MIRFIIPVYNEELNIERLSGSLHKCLPGEAKFYLFVDDCSTDNTIEKIKTFFSGEESFIITKDKNVGPGHSFNLGFEYFLENGTGNGDFIVTIEADNTSDIEIIEKMVAAARIGFDLVLASPYAQGGGFESTTIFRRLLSFVANTVLRLFFDIKVLTLSSFYRVYTPGLIFQIKNKYGTVIREPGFICMVEILIKAIKCKAEIIEVPMLLYSGRRAGNSKMKIIKTSLNYIKFMLKHDF